MRKKAAEFLFTDPADIVGCLIYAFCVALGNIFAVLLMWVISVAVILIAFMLVMPGQHLPLQMAISAVWLVVIAVYDLARVVPIAYR